MVKRARYFCYQRFYYAYPGPIRNLKQQLLVIPPDRYADQVVLDHELTVAPHPARARQRTDAFGNRVWELAVGRVDKAIAFEAIMMIERTLPILEARVDGAIAARFAAPTELTTPDERITTIAQELAATARDQAELAERINTWVADAMRYGSGATDVATPAARALALGTGLCQDYAHIMLAICRAAGLPARYVSGHMLAEGGSHAWVEVLLPHGDTFRAAAFDPTNRRRPNLSYAFVATGRDYRDVAPTSGTFSAPYGGQLSFTKRAGLTLIETMDGEIMESPSSEYSFSR